jgi:hypothetical protein
MRYLLALDQGTTSSRALLFDGRAALLGMAQEEHPQIYPEPGWVEHDPELLWQTQVRTARLRARDRGDRISNRRETTLLWERESGRPLANAIVWQDRRTATASACGGRGSSPWSGTRPASSSTPISAPPSSPGCSLTSPARAAAPTARRSASGRSRRTKVEAELEAIAAAEAIRPSGERGEAKQRLHRSLRIPMINNHRYATRDIGVWAQGMSVRLLRTGQSPDGI